MDLDLGHVLTVSALGLLTLEVMFLVRALRLKNRVGKGPGGHFLRILSRTMMLLTGALIAEVLADIHLDLVTPTPENNLVILTRLISLALAIVALLWAGWDINHLEDDE